jgi:hypothetical protein
MAMVVSKRKEAFYMMFVFHILFGTAHSIDRLCSPQQASTSSLSTSNTMSTLNTSQSAFKSDPARTMSFRATLAANASGLARPVVIRADPTLATTFNPEDKELYDLWAPAK